MVDLKKILKKDEIARSLGSSENGRLEEISKSLSKKNEIAKKQPMVDNLEGFVGC
ncbi:MAG: hypothetical protein QXF35_00785 [Candidatus Bilamarchaeaceae archaeon]